MRGIGWASGVLLLLAAASAFPGEEAKKEEPKKEEAKKAEEGPEEVVRAFGAALGKDDYPAAFRFLDKSVVESLMKLLDTDKMEDFWKYVSVDVTIVLQDADSRVLSEKGKTIVEAVSKRRKERGGEIITQNLRFEMIQDKGSWLIGGWKHGQTVEKKK
jgi:hypothetical protein